MSGHRPSSDLGASSSGERRPVPPQNGTGASERPWLCPRDHTCPARFDTHDTASAYRHGCTSPAAREAARRYRKAHSLGRITPAWVDATGTQRRIRALCALGWPQKMIAETAGLPASSFGRLLSATQVCRGTAASMARAYDELSMTVGPSDRTRAHAHRQGWLPPLAYDDDTIDVPAAKPSRKARGGPRSAPDDARYAEVARLSAAGKTAAQIAEQVGLSERQVVRIRGRVVAEPGARERRGEAA